MRPRSVLLPAIPLLISLLAIEAAADQRTIVRVRSSSGALDQRLLAELSTLGFEVRDVVSNDPDTDLAQIARANQASAAVRVNNEDAIELWVSAPQGNEPPIHETIQIDPRLGWNLAAVSALESLRAHLLPFHGEPTVAPPQVRREEVPALIRPAPRSRSPWLWVHLAGGAEASPGGLGAAAQILGELRLEPQSWLSLSVFGMFTPVSGQIDGPEGAATARHSMAGTAMDAQARVGWARVSMGLGAALAVFSLNGQAPAPGYGGQDVSIVTIGPIVRSCASVEIVHTLRLRTQLMVGITAPQAVIRFAGREVASWGRPFGLISVGLEWGVP